MRATTLGVLGLASLLAAFLLRLVVPSLSAYAWSVLGIGIVLLLLAVIIDYRLLRDAVASRRGRLGARTLLKISLFSGIILLANAISVGTYHRFDLTSLSEFTLSSQTKKVLSRLDQPVQVVNFFTPNVPATVTNYAQSLLSVYKKYTNKLSVQTVDPDLNPDVARKYHVDQYGAQYGVTVFRGKSGQREVYGPQVTAEAEYAFTSAILEVTGTQQKKVYFLIGQGEGDIYSTFNDARTALQGNLYQVAELDLLKVGSVPPDADAVVVADPTKPLSQSESAALRSYLQRGGRMLLLLNPGAPKSFQSLLSPWGIDFGNGTMIDSISFVVPNKSTPLIPRLRDYFGLSQVYFPGAAAIIPQKNPPKTLTITPLVWTSKQSWLAPTTNSVAQPSFNPQLDTKGPLAIGALVTTAPSGSAATPTDSMLAVIGDSDFASNAHFQDGNNGDLFVATINWLTQGKQLVSIQRKILPIRRLILGPEEARFLQYSSIGLLPLLLLVVAGIIWWRKR